MRRNEEIPRIDACNRTSKFVIGFNRVGKRLLRAASSFDRRVRVVNFVIIMLNLFAEGLDFLKGSLERLRNCIALLDHRITRFQHLQEIANFFL